MYTIGNFVPKDIEDDLENMSTKLEDAFASELKAMTEERRVLIDWFSKYFQEGIHPEQFDSIKWSPQDKLENANVDSGNYEKKDFLVFKDVLSSEKLFRRFGHSKATFWASREGQAMMTLSSYKEPSYAQNLRHRRYLMDIVEDKHVMFHDSIPLAVESIRSVNDGSYEVGVGFRSGCDTCDLPVLAISAKLSSLHDAIVPEGYGYCIMDRSGKTMFHSEKFRNLNENFIEETEGKFRDVFVSNTKEVKTVNYHGEKQAVLLRPMNCLENHYIAIFVNTNVFYGPFTLSLISAFALYMIYIITLIMLYLLLYIMTKRPSRLKRHNYMFSMAKPYDTPSHVKSYKRLVLLLSSVISYIWVTWLTNGSHPSFVFSEMFFFGAFCLVAIYIYSSRQKVPGEQYQNSFRHPKSRKAQNILLLAFAVIYLVRFAYLLSLVGLFPLVSFNSAIGMLLVVVVAHRFIWPQNSGTTINIGKKASGFEKNNKGLLEGIKQHSGNHTKTWAHHHWTVAYLLLMVILYAVIPINVLFSLSYSVEDSTFAKYRGAHLLDNFDQWEQTLANEFEGKFSNTSYDHFQNSVRDDGSYKAMVLLDLIMASNGEEKTDTLCDDKAQRSGFFNKLYLSVRPTYNERARLSSKFARDSSSNRRWAYAKTGKNHVVKWQKRHDGNQYLGLKINRSSFLQEHFLSVGLSILLTIGITLAFLQFAIRKIYGIGFRNIARKVGKTDNVAIISSFFNLDDATNQSTYNNIYYVGVNIAHVPVVKNAFLKYKEASDDATVMFILDMDNFFQERIDDENKTDDFKKIVSVQEYKSEEELADSNWDTLDHYVSKTGKSAFVLIEHFEFGYNDLKINKQKIELLKYLVDCKNFRVIIMSEINATKLLDYYGDEIGRTIKMMEDKQPENQLKLLERLNELKIDYKKWQHLLGSFMKCILPINQVSNDQELKHGEFLDTLDKYLKKINMKRLNGDDKILTIQQMSYPYYYSVWNALSMAERYVVYDIAKDHFVNTVNSNAITSLINKGILVYDHSLRLMNESFANFVITKVNSDEALEMEMKSKRKGSWHTALGVIILLVISLLIFLSVGQPNFLNEINALLASVGTLIALLVRFSTFQGIGSNKAG